MRSAISHFQNIDLNRPGSTMSPNPWQQHCATITGLRRRQLASLLPAAKSSSSLLTPFRSLHKLRLGDEIRNELQVSRVLFSCHGIHSV
jgi:hypothetical protein